VYPHAAQRAAPAGAPGHLHPRPRHGRQPRVGRREDRRHHLQLHARVVLADGLQADAVGLRVGPAEQGHGQQPQGLPALPLRARADAALRPLPGLLHGALADIVELQLHGRASRAQHEVRPAAGQPQGVLPRAAPPLPLPLLLQHGGARAGGGRQGGSLLIDYLGTEKTEKRKCPALTPNCCKLLLPYEHLTLAFVSYSSNFHTSVKVKYQNLY